MAIFKDKGILLKKINKGEDTTALVLLTENNGKLLVYLSEKNKSKDRINKDSLAYAYTEFLINKGQQFLTLKSANIIHNFSNIYNDYDKFVVASVFLEMADKMLFANMECKEAVSTILYSLHTLNKGKHTPKLVLATFIFKFLQNEGYMPDIEDFSVNISKNAVLTLEYILSNPPSKMFNFSISEDIVVELYKISILFIRNSIDMKLYSLELIT